MTTEIEVIEKFQKLTDKFIGKLPVHGVGNNNIKRSYSKLSGTMAVSVIKAAISKVIEGENLPYKVSQNNVYIKDCFTEWDLLIVKETAQMLDDLPIYNLNDVLVVVECKAYGLFFSKKNTELNPLKNFLTSYRSLREINNNLMARYITISERFPKHKESISYIDYTKNAMFDGTGSENSVFCFSKNRKDYYLENGYSWKDFIVNSL